MSWTLVLRVIASETSSSVYLMWGFKLKKKNVLGAQTVC